MTVLRIQMLILAVAWALPCGAHAGGAPSAQDQQAPAQAAARPADTSPLVVEAVLKAPVSEVWKLFSTPEGYRKFGVAQCEMDFRVGGRIRSHYDPQGVLGDDGTIEQEVLAYEPERMVAFRISRPPRDFPFSRATWEPTWSVATLTDLGSGRTHLRLSGLGYTTSEESQKMREFFANGNAWVMQHLQKQFDESATAPTGPAHAGDPLAPIRHERVVELPRSDVYALVATADGWRKFFDVQARIEPRPDGPFEICFDSSAPEGQRGSEGCRVLSVVPQELLSYTWNAPPTFQHARGRHTWVVWRFEALAPARTLVRLDHLGFAEQAAAHPDHRSEWEAVRAYFERAWGKVLTELARQGADRAALEADIQQPN